MRLFIKGKDIGVLSVGSGSVNDPCRLAAARQDKPLCIFATAPSMDGFASYGAPIVANGFKFSYSAKSPENIIDAVEPEALEEAWGEIRKIIRSVPSYEECLGAMKKAGCKPTVADIGKDEKLFADCTKYSPFMRKRLTLLRISTMID